MKQLTCEMCGSTDMIKQDGIFVCQVCGCKYTVEEAKKILFEVEGGKAYHLVPAEFEEASIAVSINTEGWGQFTAVSDVEDAFEAEEPTSSMILSLYEPTVYTLTAVAAEDGEDWVFVKWTKNGDDYSTDAEITVEFDESADFVAVFEYPEGE